MAERVEDLNLPGSVVTRIIKDCLPDGSNVSKEARIAVGRAASMFVLYITSAANNTARKSNRKTLSVNDVFKALSDSDFELFVQPLKDALEAHKKILQEKKHRPADKSHEGKDMNGDVNGKICKGNPVEEKDDEGEE